MVWVRPALVAEVEYGNRDRGRHPAPCGLQGPARRQGRGGRARRPPARAAGRSASATSPMPTSRTVWVTNPDRRDVRRRRPEQARARALLRPGRRLDAARADPTAGLAGALPDRQGRGLLLPAPRDAPACPRRSGRSRCARRAPRSGPTTSTSRTRAACSRSPSSARSSSTAGAAGSTSRSGPIAWSSISTRTRACPGARWSIAAFEVRRALRGPRPRAVRQDHRRQGPARRGAARAAAGLGPRCARFCRGVRAPDGAPAPKLFTANMAKSQRRGRIYLDYLRNVRGATAVAAYSLRARPGVPASTPLAWEELGEIDDPADLNYATVPERLAASSIDPWAGIDRSARRADQGDRAPAPGRALTASKRRTRSKPWRHARVGRDTSSCPWSPVRCASSTPTSRSDEGVVSSAAQGHPQPHPDEAARSRARRGRARATWSRATSTRRTSTSSSPTRTSTRSRSNSSKAIVIEKFVDAEEVDPIYFESPYYLAPDGAVAEETFRVIQQAMREKKKVGALARRALQPRAPDRARRAATRAS